ncbi:putative ATP-grasp-modified RiPP [Streptomyces sp. NPDC059578]|uniref:putative ATP-grasp-modified RiPP n=1 Tax=unclassified Streptomyces TaxID=2593676 RepID=UPI003661F878
MPSSHLVPWGLTRMRPYPDVVSVPPGRAVVDPESQTGVWLDPDGPTVPSVRHRRSRTWAETKPKTSLDGTKDEGHDQDGDTD